MCSTEDTAKRTRRQATDWEKYLQKRDLRKDCFLKYKKHSFITEVKLTYNTVLISGVQQ